MIFQGMMTARRKAGRVNEGMPCVTGFGRGGAWRFEKKLSLWL
jgi:hypothetical protein